MDLRVNADGSGKLEYGALDLDTGTLKAGTIDVEQATKDLRGLAAQAKGDPSDHFVFGIRDLKSATRVTP